MTSVLIIEDGEADQFVCKTMIEDYDPSIVVLQAYDGREALDILKKKEEEPDIILLDLNMSGMNGYEFLDHYKEQSGRKDAHLIVLTSSVLERDREQSLSYDVVEDYVQKPVTVDKISGLLDRTLA